MPKAVMFDCYNTLLRYESKEDKDGIWDMMLEAIQYMTEKKLTITAKELEKLYQKACDTEERKCIKERGPHAEVSFSRAWYEVLTKLNIPEKMAEEKAEDMLLVFRLYTRKQRHLFSNVKKELLKLKENGMKLLLLSNAQTCFIYNELPEEIRNLFDELMISENMGLKKPSEELFRIAFKRLGLKPEETVFVGDSAEDDMIPSGKLGCHCVMIGKEKKVAPSLSHVIHFNPYKESGYTGLCDVIVNIDKQQGFSNVNNQEKTAE